MGESGYDNTDLHHVRPVDCNVNSARGNLFFGSCGTTSPLSTCTTPAHIEAADDTQKDYSSFLPPQNSRGDIARAIFYMDLRYDGEEGGEDSSRNVMDLVVSDCPESVANGAGMGYLSQLLQWHLEDLPDEKEKARNDEVCESKSMFFHLLFLYGPTSSLHIYMPLTHSIESFMFKLFKIQSL